MTVKRVFVIWTNPLFHESVRLLLKHPDIVWVGTGSDYSAAREEILNLHPDTVLFEKTSSSIPMDIMEILEADTWSMRVIGLSLYDNEISEYHRQQQTVVDAEDLLHFILD